MFSGITKIGSKTLIKIEALEAISSKLKNLPVKPKTLFDFKDAVEFLSPALLDALRKNYTKDELFSVFESSGWGISKATWNYFWTILRSTDSFSHRRKMSIKPVPKLRSKNSSDVKKSKEIIPNENNHDLETPLVSDTENPVSETQNFEADNLEQSNGEQKNSDSKLPVEAKNTAHFDLPPDTEDL